LAQTILLLLALRLEGQGAEHDYALAFLETAHHFGVVEILLSELHDARVEDRLRTVGDEYQTLAKALRTSAHLGRRRE
jgi:hypothetical protein